MSMIYEALLRAEKERAQEQQPSPAGDRPRPLEGSAARPDDSQLLVETPVASDQDPSAGTGPLRVTEHPWTPDLNALPSLLSRGSQMEQFRNLRSKLYEFRSLGDLQSLFISSALPEEGKSFVTANLAVTLARFKSARVLLIDGDMRRNTQQKVLGAPNFVGLAEYLAGTASLAEVLQRGRASENGQALPNGLKDLTFLPAGNGGERAGDLSASPQFAKLLGILRPHFDWIIVDSSPVNLVSDGANLARACDGVLLVVRGGVTKFEAAQRALAELSASKVIGVVLNAVAKPEATTGYYGYDPQGTVKESS